MKKVTLKSKILLGAFLLGATGAVGHEISLMPRALEAIYLWDDDEESTVEQAKERYQCFGSGQTCATGELVSGQPTDPASVEINHN